MVDNKNNYNRESNLLEKRLKSLEKKYNQNLFTGEEIKNKIGKKIREDIIEQVDEQKKPIEKSEFPLPTEIPRGLYDESSPKQRPVQEIRKVLPKKQLGYIKEKIKISKTLHKPSKKDSRPDDGEVRKVAENVRKMKKEMSKVLIGQEEIVDGMMRGLLCNSHVLIEGVPGIAKTLAIRALGCVSGCDVKRIQFTVDLLPTDIIGITSYTPEKGFEVIKGPVFTNFLIADEINRSPPKTQSALMESMQERQATIGKKTYKMPAPFFVMATENPLENAGVYPLPEAQIDRFLFKLIMGYPKSEEEKKIMDTNISTQKFEDYKLKPVITPKEILKLQEIVKKVYLDDNIKDYILAIVKKTREKDFENAKYISYGCSPRASIGLFIASKANALMNGRDYVLPEDVKKIAPEVLRHRILLSYKANIEKISSDLNVKEILNSINIE